MNPFRIPSGPATELSRVASGETRVWGEDGKLLGTVRNGVFTAILERRRRLRVRLRRDGSSTVLGRESATPLWSARGTLQGVMDKGEFIGCEEISLVTDAPKPDAT